MASITWEAYSGAGPAWADVSTNKFIFSSSLTDLTTKVTVGAWQDGTHLGNGDPGTDQCGANHVPNVKYLTGTTMSVDGGGSENINDTNLLETECTLRIKLDTTGEGSTATQNGRFYCYDGATTTTEAVGVDVYAFERGVSASAWTQVNDDTGNIGGDNTGERLDLGDKTSATTHYWYIAVSASPESVGGKSSFDFGITVEFY
jgi:hypothetical protein